jgi:ATP-dependent Clp protease ATP-binding subunit ClpB
LFRKLNMDTIEKIVFREISRINAFYASQSIEVRFPEAELREFCIKTYSPEIGARGLPGRIKRIEAMIVEKTMASAACGGTLDIGFDAASRNFTSNWIPHDRKAA